MALRQANKVFTALGTTEISLAASADQSFMVKDILVDAPTGTAITIRVGRTTIAFLRTSGSLGNHCQFPPGGGASGNLGMTSLMGLMVDKGWHRGIPVPAGYTFVGSGPATAGAVQTVVYDEYDAGDMRADQPNGPDSNELDYVIYGDTGATITTVLLNKVDNPVNPAEFAAFPFGEAVPANTTIEVFALLASTFSPSENDGTNDFATTFLRFTHDRTVVFDPDRNGLPMWETLATQSADQVGDAPGVIGNYSDADNRSPFILTPPMVFGGGELLLVEWRSQIAGTSANFLVTDQEVGLISRIVRRA